MRPPLTAPGTDARSGTAAVATASAARFAARLDGRVYWRGLDELADTPEFRQWAEPEFPADASEWRDPVSRRHFMKIMSASFLLAGFGLTALPPASREDPAVRQEPEGYVHGVPQYYATAMPVHGTAIPLVVKSNDGRPTKIEGNALHPTATARLIASLRPRSWTCTTPTGPAF